LISLLDTNLLIALGWPNHVHHGTAIEWFKKNQAAGWATCPVTQSGFVRLSSNRKILPEAVSPQEAMALLRRITALPHHVFWSDDVAIATSEWVAPSRLLGHRQITDAHLLALALRHQGRLATLDSGIREIVPSSHTPSEAISFVLDEVGS